MNVFAKRLLAWYDKHGRKHLPWQHPIEPYRVWVSEIMLQQTQVETVIPYFERMMQRFPTVQSMAAAPVDEILHLWTGLGYYARARNLHKCAQVITEDYKGEFPQTLEKLAELPGIGPSTAAAIASIAFNQSTAILDGNVKRVLARHCAVEGWPGQTKVHNQLWEVARARMPQSRCRDYTQAIMDLGATLCTRSKPGCDDCPVAKDCLAKAQDTQSLYPGKKPKKIKPVKSVYMLMVQNPDGEILLEQRPPSGIWGGLWCLPECDTNNDWQQQVALEFGQQYSSEHWPQWRHTFSHYHLDIQPVRVNLRKPVRKIMEGGGRIWYNLRQPVELGLAAPVKRLLQNLSEAQTPTQSTHPVTETA